MTASPDLVAAADFMWRAARLIDRARFRADFLDGEREPVLRALAAYQHADGGFGSALEPDLRGPDSQPVATWTALCVLDELDAFGSAMVRRACDYLTTITLPDGGLPCVLPTAHAYPHAPWWGPRPVQAELNPTAAILGLLLKHGVAHPWMEPASAFCWRQVDAITTTEPYEVRCVLPFLEHAPDRDRAEAAFLRLGAAMREQGIVALDIDTPGHVHGPLNFAPRPRSIARRLFDDATIERHLDALVARQQSDGGWPINWEPWTPVTLLEWRGWATVEALQTLRAYGRL